MDVSIRTIQPMAQQVAEAIAAALKMEVEIADQELLRVAGTGPFRDGVMHTMSRDGYVYQEVISSGKPVMIEEPGFHGLCRSCKFYRNCPERAELSCAIQMEDQIYGVIGLVAMNDDQRERLLTNSEALLDFLGKMGDLIAAKLRERQATREQLVAGSQIQTLINYLDRGLLALDAQGRVTHANSKAGQLLGGSVIDLVGQPLAAVVPGFKLDPSSRQSTQLEASFKVGKGRRHLLFDISPIWVWERMQGAVVTLEDEADVSRMVSQYTNPELPTGSGEIRGSSPQIQEVRSLIQRVAPSDSSVLIRGETGTGKELCARAVHAASPRSAGPFVAINCGAIPEPLLESELFGYDDGAFTGARRGGKMGKFQLAEGGTLFLDEIGDMPLHLQVKLLRALQDRRVERVGGTRPIPIDVRIIAATNRNLEELLAIGAFREDLYYRLNVIPIQMPTLRERKEDILPLARHFLTVYNSKLGKRVTGFTPEAEDLIQRHLWPGNARELSNVIEYAVNLQEGSLVTVSSLPQRVRNAEVDRVPAPVPTLNLRELERQAVGVAVARCRQEDRPLDQAASLLGIGRATLFRKLKEYRM